MSSTILLVHYQEGGLLSLEGGFELAQGRGDSGTRLSQSAAPNSVVEVTTKVGAE